LKSRKVSDFRDILFDYRFNLSEGKQITLKGKLRVIDHPAKWRAFIRLEKRIAHELRSVVFDRNLLPEVASVSSTSLSSWTKPSDHDIIVRLNLRFYMNEVYRAKLNDEGRLVIPAACRKLLGMSPGQELLLQISEQGLIVYTQDVAVKRLQDWVTSHVPPGVSLVDELIADRRAEAARELDE
jgi:bifunctional DNA-binding transcriptional regulator/antitoxin component of YhaV-PrlF toxin-antitoxin module